MQYKYFVFNAQSERIAHSEADTEQDAIFNLFNKNRWLNTPRKVTLKLFEKMKKEGYKVYKCRGGWEISA